MPEPSDQIPSSESRKLCGTGSKNSGLFAHDCHADLLASNQRSLSSHDILEANNCLRRYGPGVTEYIDYVCPGDSPIQGCNDCVHQGSFST